MSDYSSVAVGPLLTGLGERSAAARPRFAELAHAASLLVYSLGGMQPEHAITARDHWQVGHGRAAGLVGLNGPRPSGESTGVGIGQESCLLGEVRSG